MRLSKLLFVVCVGLALWAGGAQALPGDPNYVFVKSEPPTVMQIGLADVLYTFQGQATIPFTVRNSRAHVWLAVYTKDQATPGGYGGPTSPVAPDGALWRKPGIPNLVAVVDKGQFEVGSHTVTWDGKDWQGNAVPVGDYTLYLIGLNDLDDVNVIGPGGGSGLGYGRLSVDANYPAAGSHTISVQGGPGIMRYQIGAQNWLQDPQLKGGYPVYEMFNVQPSLGLSYATDSNDPDVGYLASVYGGGVAKFRFLTAPSTERVTQFGPDGTGHRTGSDITTNAPKFQSVREYKGRLYITHGDWGQDPPQSELIVLDKETGQTVGRVDLTEWFNVEGLNAEGKQVSGSNGPAVLFIDDEGILLANGGWGTGADAQGPDGGSEFGIFMKVGHDGRSIWINDNGDGFGDTISKATADALGIAQQQQGVQTIWGIPANSADDAAGFAAIAEVGPESDSFGAIIGPDGSGLLHVRTTKAGTQTLWQTGNFIIQDGSAYDGFYFQTGSGAVPSIQAIKDNVGGGQVIGHLPMDIAKATIGPRVTAVVEEVSATAPAAYVLGDAYPNPFNPSTTIEFAVPEAVQVRLEVYSTSGQLVCRLVDQVLAAGHYRTGWDATDSAGQRVGSGTYLYTVQAGSFVQTKKFTLLR
jgi:flagellar hook assembly protein FlgD